MVTRIMEKLDRDKTTVGEFKAGTRPVEILDRDKTSGGSRTGTRPGNLFSGARWKLSHLVSNVNEKTSSMGGRWEGKHRREIVRPQIEMISVRC